MKSIFYLSKRKRRRGPEAPLSLLFESEREEKEIIKMGPSQARQSGVLFPASKPNFGRSYR